ncbi:MAG: hypothetical protein FWG36_05760 [Oscillospiraceae bacterium]|nr:hypothetical protein [Oscillospiraceae bacterium]
MPVFRETIDPRCGYCQKGRQISQNEIGCVHRGVVSAHYSCKKFVYDPYRRVPPKPVRLNKNYSDKDFEL